MGGIEILQTLKNLNGSRKNKTKREKKKKDKMSENKNKTQIKTHLN